MAILKLVQPLFYRAIFVSLFSCLILIANNANAGQLKNLDTQSLHGTVIDKPRLIKDFTLQNSDGKSLTAKNLKNHWTFLFFGFTRCGYVCPTSMTALKQVYADLQKNSAIPKPQVVFISIDPERDDAARIHHYVTSFNPDFIGATGNKTALNQLTSQLGILYMKIIHTGQKEKTDNYDIDHTGSILLVDPDGELIAVFSMPHQAEHIAKDYVAITSHYAGA